MIIQKENGVYYRQDKEQLYIQPWGENSFRVRATQRADFMSDEMSVVTMPKKDRSDSYQVEKNAFGDVTIINGKIKAVLFHTGKIVFYNQKGEVLLEEYERQRDRNHIPDHFNSALEIPPRVYKPHQGTSNYQIEVRFESNENEKIYGMGQYQQPYLDVKGCVLELAQRNSQASVPFMISNQGYGFLWNNPAIGSVSFGKNLTEWMARSSSQVDYWITAGDTPSEILETYANVSGKVPMMPDFGTGFWQCKLRYQTQDEIMNVAREYKRRELPISLIVVDFFHWPFQGDWKFDKDYWPDPQGMINELKEMGIELMVSIWPTVEVGSENYAEMVELGLLTRSEYGNRQSQLFNASLIDATNPETRKYVWGKIKENYYDLGIRIFWLDEAEPEFTNYEFEFYRYHLGANLEVGNIYPKVYAQMAYEGMEKQGQENIVNLLRCAWAGSQKYGALVWSGDIDSSFRSLRNQLVAGLNMGLAGIPWWTTDIGGFHGGNIHDKKFWECMVRWFQFGTFCPVMRLHGFREPFQEPLGTTGGGKQISGADNEVWSYGEENYEIFKKFMQTREKIRP
ncbi:MAG: family 31 glucosidase, partial [Clostridiales bacterium]|nr:family 31 glucosidase [Clostridiales bacterium]